MTHPSQESEMPDLGVDLDRLDELVAAGHDVGNWRMYPNVNGAGVMFDYPHDGLLGNRWTEADAEMVVALVNAAPELIRRLRAAEAGTPAGPEERGEGLREAGLVRCPLCGDPERTEDIVGGVCLTCADGIAFSQNARRGSIEVAATPAPDTGAEERLWALTDDLTDAEEERLAEQLRRMDFMNWTARENAARLAAMVRSIFAARVRSAFPALHDSASSGTGEP